MQKRLVVFAFLLFWGKVEGAQPSWWTQGATAFIDPNASHSVAGNYAPANIGQLKYVAKKAKLYLDQNVPGGSGLSITALINNLSSGNPADNYTPINIGQLKAVAKIFYDRLADIGYGTRSSLAYHGVPNWQYDYPWNPSAPQSDNYAVANIGQLKLVFSFDVTDTDGDGLPDWWESQYGGGSSVTLDGDGVHDADSDGISDLTAYQIGWNPVSNHLNNPTETESLNYDAANRLENVIGRSVLTYGPDANGNLLQTTNP